MLSAIDSAPAGLTTEAQRLRHNLRLLQPRRRYPDATVRQVAGYILGELLAHLDLDRALLYLNVEDRSLVLYLAQRRGQPPGTTPEEQFQVVQMFANQAAITISSLEPVDRCLPEELRALRAGAGRR